MPIFSRLLSSVVVFVALLVALCAATQRAQAAVCSLPYTFVNGTTADANQVNSNFTSIQTCANSVDNTQIGPAGIYASQIIPISLATATFGGSFAYTFNNGINNTNYTSIATNAPLTLTSAAAASATYNFKLGTTTCGSTGLYELTIGATVEFQVGCSGTTTIAGNLVFGASAAVLSTGGDSHCGLTISGFEVKSSGGTYLGGADSVGNYCSGASVEVPSGSVFYQNGVGSPPLGDIMPVIAQGTVTISGACANGAVCALSSYPSCGTPIVGCWWAVWDLTNGITPPGGLVVLPTRASGVNKLGGVLNETGGSVANGDTIAYAAIGG